MAAVSRIVVPIDFSGASAVALSFARGLARSFGAGLHLIHVVDDVEARTRLAPTESQRRASERLHALLTEEDRQLRVCCAVVASGLPAFAIVEYAKTIAADMIVIAPDDSGALPAPFLGLCTQRILRTAPCPVFVLREPGCRAPAELTAAGAAAAGGSSSSPNARS
jgi:nucleotide-binding universal stress UspA family protein